MYKESCHPFWQLYMYDIDEAVLANLSICETKQLITILWAITSNDYHRTGVRKGLGGSPALEAASNFRVSIERHQTGTLDAGEDRFPVLQSHRYQR